jgi:hypothetical protein
MNEYAKPEGSSSFWLRSAGLSAVLVGAVGSLGLFFYASQHPPLFLVVLFLVWILSPFVALGAAHMISRRWSNLTRTTLSVVMLVVGLGTLVVYGDDAIARRTAHAAAVYVVVAPASWLLIAIALTIAAVISRRRSRRDDKG